MSIQLLAFSRIIDLEELLCNNCVIEHEFPPYCVNPLTVAEGKKLRLVIDLRHVNAFVSKVKFKYEDLRSLYQVLEENHWFFTSDLKSGYHHVDIFADHQKYLGFSWITNYLCRSHLGYVSQLGYVSHLGNVSHLGCKPFRQR